MESFSGEENDNPLLLIVNMPLIFLNKRLWEVRFFKWKIGYGISMNVSRHVILLMS